MPLILPMLKFSNIYFSQFELFELALIISWQHLKLYLLIQKLILNILKLLKKVGFVNLQILHKPFIAQDPLNSIIQLIHEIV